LLCAKICHDLISPVGALGNAVEILDDEDNQDMYEDAINLVKTSSRQASAKLKFLRIALGAGGSAPGVIPTSEIMALTNDMFMDSKPDLVWNIDSDGLDKNHARIVMNLAMLAVQAAPRGGSVKISGQNSGAGAAFTILSDGPSVRLDAAVAQAIAGKMPEGGIDGRSIQPLYANLLARDIGGSIGAADEDSVIRFTADFPAAAA
jgi:histidine phosphotransferase ChpT